MPRQAANINIGRDVFAGFGEIRIPVDGPSQNIPGVYSFDIDGAVRFENYSSSGSDTVSKAGLTSSSDQGYRAPRHLFGELHRADTLRDQRSDDHRRHRPRRFAG